MPESDLYEPVRNYLELRFSDGLKPPSGVLRPISAITATAGGPGTGQWSKPDLCLIALWRHKYSPHWRLDLHGFEVKPESRCKAESVHEALNHTSQVHFAHLVWHKPNWDDADDRCKEILDRCQRYGVGLITLAKPDDARSYLVRLVARRHDPSGDAVDEFIETRIPDTDKKKLIRWLSEVR
jgi:hypothetical protein